MNQLFKHTFVKKPFYKWFHKCTVCDKRKIWTPMGKCSGCKTYCHRRCIRLDDDVCLRSTATGVRTTDRDQQTTDRDQQTTDRDQQTTVTLPDEDGRDQEMDIRPYGSDVRELNPAEDDLAKDYPNSNVDGSQVHDNSELAEQRPLPLAADGGDFGATKQLKDETSEVIEKDSVSDVGEGVKPLVVKSVPDGGPNDPSTKRSVDEVTAADEYSTPPANEEPQAYKPRLSSSIPPVRHISDSCLMNFEFPRSCWPTRTLLIQVEPIRGCAPFQLPPYRLSCAGTEPVECQKDNGVSVEMDKCIDATDLIKDASGDKKLE